MVNPVRNESVDDPADTASSTNPIPVRRAASGTGPNGNPGTTSRAVPTTRHGGRRIPLEGILGWDTTVNGNLAEQLQEPSLMGAYEGAGITVLSKGVNIPAGLDGCVRKRRGSSFPDRHQRFSRLPIALTGAGRTNPYPSNFQCNPSSIDGLSITDAPRAAAASSCTPGRITCKSPTTAIYNNTGTLSGGMSIGQGESPEAYLSGTAADRIRAPARPSRLSRPARSCRTAST